VYWTQIWSNAGNIRPRIDRQNDPTRDKKTDRSGIATAQPTKNNKNKRVNKFINMYGVTIHLLRCIKVGNKTRTLCFE